jgi:SpoVK/Ycf46/Vps4 family AAA+-type ATPase
MDRNNKFLSGVYYDLYHRRKNKTISSQNTDSSGQKTNPDSGSEQLESELKTIIDEFYSKQGISSHQENESKPFMPDEIRAEIEKLIGLNNIKEDIEALMDFVKIQKLRREHGLKGSRIVLHTAFIGNPGTGKTTVARLMGEYFKALGVLKKGHLVEVTRADLVGQYVGATAAKTNKIIDKALDGILFIDEAYALSTGDDKDFGKEAINILVDRMEKDREMLAVFLAGYEDSMKMFLESNPGLASRVSRKFYFRDYTGTELLQIFQRQMDKNEYTMSDECLKVMEKYFCYLYDTRDNNFGNGRVVRNIFERLVKCQADRLAEEDEVTVDMLKTFTIEDIERAVPVKDIIVTSDKLDSVMNELEQYVGLKNIKDHIRSLINMIKTNQKREELGLPVKQLTYHAIFCGSPGTGKTTIARILGRIYQTLGVLKKGHVVEVDRSGLVAGYVGQTEEKTNKAIDKAMDGILFIDEAYALAGGNNDFGKNAIDTILKRMDDDRERLIVIAAGYTEKMRMFINSNPGLKDRFSWTFEFKDYTEKELMDIFLLFAQKQHYILSDEAIKALSDHFHNIYRLRDEHFGNGRYVRNLFEKVVMEQSSRIGANIENVKRDELSIITENDVSRALLLL